MQKRKKLRLSRETIVELGPNALGGQIVGAAALQPAQSKAGGCGATNQGCPGSASPSDLYTECYPCGIDHTNNSANGCYF
jgi:hypothetical protein